MIISICAVALMVLVPIYVIAKIRDKTYNHNGLYGTAKIVCYSVDRRIDSDTGGYITHTAIILKYYNHYSNSEVTSKCLPMADEKWLIYTGDDHDKLNMNPLYTDLKVQYTKDSVRIVDERVVVLGKRVGLWEMWINGLFIFQAIGALLVVIGILMASR